MMKMWNENDENEINIKISKKFKKTRHRGERFFIVENGR